MTSIRTGNARRRRLARRALGDHVLQSWSCYVDAIEGRKVYLVMRDTTNDRGDEEIYGTFPRRLFSGIDVKLGLYLTVEALKSRRIVIRPTPLDPDAPNEGAKLAELLRRARFDEAGQLLEIA